MGCKALRTCAAGLWLPGTGMLNQLSMLFIDNKDIAERTLRLLPLTALGVLSCSCKGLRASVAAAPTAWQAAAARQYPSVHPVLLAADIPGYLQRQHTIHTNISRRQCSLVQQDYPGADWCTPQLPCVQLLSPPRGKAEHLSAMQVEPGPQCLRACAARGLQRDGRGHL